jgi:hypothetical protein
MKDDLTQMGLGDLESTIIKGILGLPEQAFQIPISGLLSSTQLIIQNQTAESGKEIINLEEKLSKKPPLPNIHERLQNFINFLIEITQRIEIFFNF